MTESLIIFSIFTIISILSSFKKIPRQAFVLFLILPSLLYFFPNYLNTIFENKNSVWSIFVIILNLIILNIAFTNKKIPLIFFVMPFVFGSSDLIVPLGLYLTYLCLSKSKNIQIYLYVLTMLLAIISMLFGESLELSSLMLILISSSFIYSTFNSLKNNNLKLGILGELIVDIFIFNEVSKTFQGFSLEIPYIIGFSIIAILGFTYQNNSKRCSSFISLLMIVMAVIFEVISFSSLALISIYFTFNFCETKDKIIYKDLALQYLKIENVRLLILVFLMFKIYKSYSINVLELSVLILMLFSMFVLKVREIEKSRFLFKSDIYSLSMILVYWGGILWLK